VTQEDIEASSTEEAERSIKGEVFDWLTNNFFFAILPLFVAYLALPISGNPATVLERGDAFILTAALLAPEIAALRNLKSSTTASSVKSLLNVMFLLVILSTVLFITSTSNYNATHPSVIIGNEGGGLSATSNKTEASPPFPTLTDNGVVILSVIMLTLTIAIVYFGIRERQRLGGSS
jgi:hypothetical protein